MKLVLLIFILTTVAALALVLVVALYHHKKAGTGEINLIGELAHVDTELNPEGTVIVGGELWRAKSIDGAFILTRARVRVVGFENHLVLVERCDEKVPSRS
jgi:membrane-bound ClpP family serine protease